MTALHAAALVAAHAGSHQAHHNPSSWLLAAAGLLGGFAVGITGMGGGALMTPILVLLFGIDVKVAIASDLVNSLVMKPVGGGVHLRRGTIHKPLVVRLVAGSVPAAFVGAYAINRLSGTGVQQEVKTVLGWALVVACASLVAKSYLSARRRRSGDASRSAAVSYEVKTAPTVLVGVAGGFIVGMTSVGSGSLMIVLLMLLYPQLTSKSLVGTDLVQAVPLVASATLGQLAFGHISFAIAGALLAGSVPGVYAGARVSAKAPDAVVRPVLVVVLAASALSLLFDTDTHGLAWTVGIGVVIGVALWGAADATLRAPAEWSAAGASRLRWVSVMAIGAPFGVGLAAAVVYFAVVRPALTAASSAGGSAALVGVGDGDRLAPR